VLDDAHGRGQARSPGVTGPANPQVESLRRMAGAPAYNRWLVDRARPYLGRRVLDAGAGSGTLTRLVAGEVDEVVALEPDAELLPHLRGAVAGEPNVTVVHAAAEQLPALSLGRFDSVLCLNVLEHVADDEGALRSFRAALVPGGRVLLLVPAHPRLYGEIDRVVDHERRYSRPGLESLLARCGLEVVALRPVNPLGALGWLVSSRLLRRRHVPEGPLRAYDRLVPLLRPLDRLPLPFGLSLWAVARRPEGADDG
jgi:SAM-dependent methyltransferase